MSKTRDLQSALTRSPSVDGETYSARLAEKLSGIVLQMERTGDWRMSEAEAQTVTDAAKWLLALSAPPVEPVAWRRTFSEIKKIALTMKSDSIQDGLGHIVRLCIDAGSPPSSSRNWTEDASHENGNYECCCVECNQPFIGHKRRVICKACSKLLSPAAPPSQPDTVREDK